MATSFERMMNGLNEVEGYLSGNTKGHKVNVPGEVDVKAVRKRLGLTQVQFSNTFRLSIDNVKNWESNRRQPEAPARILLRVIESDPASVIYALHPGAAKVAAHKTRKDSYAKAKRALAAASSM
jgi:putative transcriptional regulator